jgi:aminomethyltransferase
MLYSLLCDEKAGILDDILIYQEGEDDYYLIVNASSIARDMQALLKYAPESLLVEDRSDKTACIAVQGPKSEGLLEKIFGFKLKELAYYSFMAEKYLGEPVWISRSGYTGEDGFEIFSSNELSLKIWDKLAVEGKAEGALPAGLGARNTLRLEAGNALYGSDMDVATTPLEAGLGWAVSFQKGPFVGRDRMMAQRENGLSRKLIGFKMLDKPVARDNYPIYRDGKKIGRVTSGSFAPSAGCNIGLGYVNMGFQAPGTLIEIEIHGRLVKAEVVSRPFIELKHRK